MSERGRDVHQVNWHTAHRGLPCGSAGSDASSDWPTPRLWVCEHSPPSGIVCPLRVPGQRLGVPACRRRHPPAGPAPGSAAPLRHRLPLGVACPGRWDGHQTCLDACGDVDPGGGINAGLRWFFNNNLAVMGGQAHALAAADEMRELADDLRTILRRTGVRSPANDRATRPSPPGPTTRPPVTADEPAGADRSGPEKPGCAGAGPIFEGPLKITMFSRGQYGHAAADTSTGDLHR